MSDLRLQTNWNNAQTKNPRWVSSLHLSLSICDYNCSEARPPADTQRPPDS